MNTTERRNAILRVLCQERHGTIDSFAMRFNSSRRTIRRDIEMLSCTYPIKTVRGKYGGVYLESWYRPDRRQLTQEQTALLRRILPSLSKEEQLLIQGILAQFGPTSPL